jgi:hypothetical protein
MSGRKRRLRALEPSTSKMNYATVRHLVEEAFSADLLNLWKDYVLAHPRCTNMWGREQIGSFERRMVTLAIYKDFSGLGYQKILKSIELGFKLESKCYLHNTKIVREILAEWGAKQINIDGVQSWNEHAKYFPKKVGLRAVNLIIDSTDFRLSGKASISRKDPKWSYKLNAPGQRFQVICNARGRVQRLWGGYSPKVYDGEWVDIMKEELVHHFSGAHIIADTHYEMANRIFKKIGKEKQIVFYTPIAKPRGRKPKTMTTPTNDQSRGLRVLTTQQQEWNKRVSHVRARIESPFGLIKMKWKGLGSTFFEDEDQQNFLVFLAVGTHNYMIERI